MTLDRELTKEIKALRGDGTRSARFELLKKLSAAAQDMSTIKVKYEFETGTYFRKHGRAAVAICVAETLYANRWRLDNWGLDWARAVLALLPKFDSAGSLERALIKDDLHPTEICAYAGSFIRATTEEES